MRHIKNYFGEL